MNYRLLVAGVFSAEYSYISKWVVQLLSSAKKLAHPQTLLHISSKNSFHKCSI